MMSLHDIWFWPMSLIMTVQNTSCTSNSFNSFLSRLMARSFSCHKPKPQLWIFVIHCTNMYPMYPCCRLVGILQQFVVVSLCLQKCDQHKELETLLQLWIAGQHLQLVGLQGELKVSGLEAKKSIKVSKP